MLKWNLDIAVGGMTVGDSFFVPCLDCASARTTLIQLGRMFKYEVTVKSWVENGIKGVRIWRLR